MSTTTQREATIEAVPDLPVIKITREFDATPERVFRAHVDPDLYARWVGPNSGEIEIQTWDARTGGSWAFSGTSAAGENSFYGSFHEVRPPERIVQTFTWAGDPDGVSLETLTLEALDGGRCRLVATSVVETIESRDAWLASGMEIGVNDGYAKLDALLAGVE